MKYKRNINISYITTFLSGLEFALPIMALYYRQELETNFLVTVILSFKSFATVLLEVPTVPTGVLTDRIGRKSTLLLSKAFGVVYLGLIIVGSHLWIFLLAMAVGSASATLSSGTMTSLVYESVQRMERDPPSFKRVTAILHALWPVAASVASVAGSLLAPISLRLPIVMMLPPLLISITLITRLHEPFSAPIEEDNAPSVWMQVKESAGILRGNRQVFILVGLGFLGYIGEVNHQLKPIYFEFKDIDLVYFGVLYGLTFGLVFVGSMLSDPVSRALGDKDTLIAMGILSLVFVRSSIVTKGILSGLLLSLSSLSWGVKWPVISDLLNKELEDRNRTTLLSVNNMFKMLSLAVFAPLFGRLVDLYSILTLYWIDWGLSIFLVLPCFFLRSDEEVKEGSCNCSLMHKNYHALQSCQILGNNGSFSLIQIKICQDLNIK